MDYFGSRKEIIKLRETSITCVINLSHCYMNIALIYGGKKPHQFLFSHAIRILMSHAVFIIFFVSIVSRFCDMFKDYPRKISQ